MSGLLSDSEIKDLLNKIASEDDTDSLAKTEDEDENKLQPSENGLVKYWDFKRPKRFSTKQLRAVSYLFSDVCRANINAIGKLFGDESVSVHVACVDELSFMEFLESVPEKTNFLLSNVILDNCRGSIISELDEPIAIAVKNASNKVSSIDEFMKLLLKDFEIVFNEAKFSISINKTTYGTTKSSVQVFDCNEKGALITMEVQIKEEQGLYNVFIPADLLKPALLKQEKAMAELPPDRERIDVSKIGLPLLQVIKPIEMEAGEFAKFKVGDIINFETKETTYLIGDIL